MGDFYGTGIEIWALDLGWIWAGSATFEAGFFMLSWANFFLNIVDGENIFGIE